MLSTEMSMRSPDIRRNPVNGDETDHGDSPHFEAPLPLGRVLPLDAPEKPHRGMHAEEGTRKEGAVREAVGHC